MPFPVRKKPAAPAAGSRIPKLGSNTEENQDDGSQVKRCSSPPKGAPKKRTAFIDITNAHKLSISLPGKKKQPEKKNVVKKKSSSSSSSVSNKNQNNLKKSPSESLEESSTSEEEKESPNKDEGIIQVCSTPPVPAHLQKQHIPAEFDIDSEKSEDCYMCPEYAKDIFDYLRHREEKFVLRDYMQAQPNLNPEMRSILVDWLVEVQENFELYHETLYLAITITDHFLSKSPIQKETLQLVGSTAMLLASKFEERSPPCVDDFLYICDDAYKKEELISMEANILQTLSFDISIPIPYRFLRRYAKCVSAGMDTLTLARYYCELSLMEMDLVTQRGSLLAASCLFIALLSKQLGRWSPILEFHSGYSVSDLAPVVRKLFAALSAPPDDKLKAVRSKYSHKVFFEVATLPLVNEDQLEEALSSA